MQRFVAPLHLSRFGLLILFNNLSCLHTRTQLAAGAQSAVSVLIYFTSLNEYTDPLLKEYSTTQVKQISLSARLPNPPQAYSEQNDRPRYIYKEPPSLKIIHPSILCHSELCEEFQSFTRHWELCEKPKMKLRLLGGQNILHLSPSVLIIHTFWKLGRPNFK